jgi:hypothetical protein
MELSAKQIEKRGVVLEEMQRKHGVAWVEQFLQNKERLAEFNTLVAACYPDKETICQKHVS